MKDKLKIIILKVILDNTKYYGDSLGLFFKTKTNLKGNTLLLKRQMGQALVCLFIKLRKEYTNGF